jgi:predicted secreted hydrolase
MKSRWIAFLVAASLFLTAAGAPAQQYQLALPGYQFQFPRDYFNHENYQTEWWYYTGNLRARDGRRFGLELTFFRQGISRAADASPWYVHDLWMAHLALSDIHGQRFYHEERLNRSGPGIAGVNAASGIVWNGNWQAHITPREEDLRATGRDFTLALQLVPTKPPDIQGQDGVSRKSSGVGRASHYYSLTRLQTSGWIHLNGEAYQVVGTSWMDHEFFTGSMAPDESGWDWLSVQFKDGSDLMLYRMRRKDGSIDPYSSGSYADANGRSRFLSSRDFEMTPASDVWISPKTKAAYPLRWHVSVPEFHLDFDVTTHLRSQEMTGKFGPSYWEGAIDAAGTFEDKKTHGVGYLEMTGYSEAGGQLLPQ